MLRAAVLIVFAFMAIAPAYDPERDAAEPEDDGGSTLVVYSQAATYAVLPRRIRAPQLSGYDDPGTAE